MAQMERNVNLEEIDSDALFGIDALKGQSILQKIIFFTCLGAGIVANVKQVAKALLFLEEHDIRDLETLNQRAKEAADHFNELSATIKSAEKRMAEISVLRTHILNYVKTKDVYVAYRKSGYSKAFFEAHREEITLHKAAKQAFSDLGVEKLPTVKQLNEEFAVLLAKKKEAYREYRKAKQEMTDFATAKYDIERFLNLEQEVETREKEKAKSKEEALL